MKKLMAIIAASAITAMAGTAMAATTTTDLTVSATVDEVCTASTTTNIDFGTLNPLTDPATSSTATKPGATSGIIRVSCTEGTDYDLSGPATVTTIGNGTDTIVYTPVVPGGTFTGSVAGNPHTIDATVNLSAYEMASAGAYTGTLTVTVTY